MSSKKIVARFPYSHSKLIGEMMGKSILNIAPNPPGTLPVPYKNFKRGRSDFCRLTIIDGPETPWWLIWYFMEFIGHLEYLDKNFETFRDVICERIDPERPGTKDFTKYLSSIITDSKSVYNKQLYTYFQVMWLTSKPKYFAQESEKKCDDDVEIARIREKTWNRKLTELRKAFNQYIQKRMSDYELKKNKPHYVFNEWKTRLEAIYGDNWGSYLFQCANFDELGQFILEYNQVYKKNESAKLLYCRLKLPESLFTIAGHKNQQLAEIDNNSNIRIWARGIKVEGNTYVYPATPDAWTTGSRSIMLDYKWHTSIFPNSDISKWLSDCEENGVKVKFLVVEGDMTTDNYENDKIITNTGKVVACSNKNDLAQRIIQKPARPVCGKNESSAEFADRMLEWSNITYLTTGVRTYK